ncbi:hypothetical protein [Hansschlegelia zhihuaiae]|uniref:Uncharacterized protein n=1 Tax=Hansschlegelia zhihuaiae TaxID=405005 RepID=A0A4Q0MF19_9HYPH|nr:hypothetical protein [Hansschlegelia zhihuaiae]RXF72081.1 hypothetical protein EK403_14830 [Hansschlegelia zhihuaiae]
MTPKIRDFDPSAGQAFQGDVAIVPVPAGIAIARTDEIAPVAGRIILQEGEVTGHHHAIALMERPEGEAATRPSMRTSKVAEGLMADALAGRIAVPTARMYRDRAAADAMVRKGVLTRSDLCVGFLVVEHGPMTVTHEEHDGVRLPVGSYYIGRQVESAGAEERRVAD